jgi:hypothetical protein
MSIELKEILKNSLALDGSPDGAADKVLSYDASADALKVINPEDIGGATGAGNALDFVSARHGNLTHGIVYDKDTDYTKFMYEAYLVPKGEGYVFITGKGGSHILAIQLVNGPFGGYQINGHVDRDSGGLTSINFQSVDEMRANEPAHIAVHYDQSYLTTIINGVPCSTVAGTLARRCTTQLDQVGFTGGSDHNSGQFRMACQRIFEGDVPFDGAYGVVVRPAIEEMAGRFVWNASRKVSAYLINDFRNGDLVDSSGNGFNGYMYDTSPFNFVGDGANASIGSYTEPVGNRDPSQRPQWVNDLMPYSGSHASPATPPVGVLFYDSFGRQDVNYTRVPPPLHLGTVEVGGVTWIDSGYGIINGNAFTTELGSVPALIDVSRQDVDVRMTRPTAFDSTLSSNHVMYLRYTDANNNIRIEVSDGGTNSVQAKQRVGGVETSLGSVTNFTANAWTQLKATCVGTALNIYEGNTLRGGPFTINAGLTGTKTGFRLSTPLIRIADFAVFAG